jgi:hypothetical protein
MKLKIFYSWQTDTNEVFNRYFIKDSIKEAIKKLENKPEFKDVEFDFREGVTGEAGSVPVASQIIEKIIPTTDIFITDLTVTNLDFGEDIPEEIIEKLKKTQKPSPNPNVLIEYGVAYDKLGYNRIIGIINTEYGTPKIDIRNIPFDIRHLRYPIDYTYSKKTEQVNVLEIKKQLVNDLLRAIKDVAIYSIQNNTTKFRPFLTWNDWYKEEKPEQKFFLNPYIIDFQNQILEVVKKNEVFSIRIFGLSGLGKTRILLETFKANDDDERAIIISGRILYINFNENEDIEQTVRKIVENGEDKILIIDNCSSEIHRKLNKIIFRSDSKTSLFTISSNPEERFDKIRDVSVLYIEKNELISVVEDILKEYFDWLTEDKIKTIKDFSQGIPLMAVLLGESVKNGEQYIGRLEDRDLMNKLLGLNNNDDEKQILMSCSLFNYFGFFEDYFEQSKFIATNKEITPIDGEDETKINKFQRVCNKYFKRGIFEKKGRLLGMRPFPLAISLTEEWFENCNSKKLLSVIESIAKLDEPHRKILSNSMCEQMKFLGYSESAKIIIEKLVCENSPFDNAGVLNTELGSRLFRSFVEVNPNAISDNMFRVFSKLNSSELIQIVEGRRNLVWVFEKLCFNKSTFNKSIKTLYAFAVAENETWANNATGQFLQLFSILLPGTEANLFDRFEIIKWGLENDDNEYFNLALKAMDRGLSSDHFHRTLGAEQQGTLRRDDYRPSNSEIQDYWTKIIELLLHIIKENNNFSEIASDILANNIRSICRARCAHLIIPKIKETAEFKNFDWEKGLLGLKYVKKYDKGYITREQLDEIELIILSLTKNDLKSKLENFSKNSHIDIEERFSHEKQIERINGLVIEFVENKSEWSKIIPILYGGYFSYAFQFGKYLSELIKEDDELYEFFLTQSFDFFKKISSEKSNLNVLGGFYFTLNSKQKTDLIEKIIKEEDLKCHIFYLQSVSATFSYIMYLFELINSKCDFQSFLVFRFSNILQDLNSEEFNIFANKLFSYKNDGYEIGFKIFFGLGFNNSENQKKLRPFLIECLLNINFETCTIDRYELGNAIIQILQDKKEVEFAKHINISIIKSITWHNSYHLDDYVKKVYDILLGEYFEFIWEDLSKFLLSEDEEYIKFYGLKHILGSSIGSSIERQVGVIMSGQINTIFEWCMSNIPVAPARLAELIPVFGNNNDLYNELNPIAEQLINEFGNNDEVLSGLSSNLGSFSWVGSMIPLLEAKIEIFRKLINHKHIKVKEWAENNIVYLTKQIEQERIREEEMYLK